MLIWQTNLDDDVCPRCRALHGQRDGDGWTSTPRTGSDDVGPPPLHPNCRCHLVDVPDVLEFVEAVT